MVDFAGPCGVAGTWSHLPVLLRPVQATAVSKRQTRPAEVHSYLETVRGIDIASQMEAGNHGAQVSGDVNASTAARPDSETASSPIWLAFAWGLASAASLPVGAILAIYTRPREKLSANLMAFGGGSFPHPPACCAYCVCTCARMTRGRARMQVRCFSP